MDALNKFGKFMLNYAIAPDIQSFLNYQIYNFTQGLSQIHKIGTFNVNYALTADPSIHDGVLDLDMYFDVGPQLNKCVLNADTNEY